MTSNATPTPSRTACRTVSGWSPDVDGIWGDSWPTMSYLPLAGGNQALLDSQGVFSVAFETRAVRPFSYPPRRSLADNDTPPRMLRAGTKVKERLDRGYQGRRLSKGRRLVRTIRREASSFVYD